MVWLVPRLPGVTADFKMRDYDHELFNRAEVFNCNEEEEIEEKSRMRKRRQTERKKAFG